MGPPLMDDEWIYGSEPENIFATIVEGRPNGMPSFRGRIPDYQVWQLVAYVRSMSGLCPSMSRRRARTHGDGTPRTAAHATPERPKQAVTPRRLGARLMRAAGVQSALQPAGPQPRRASHRLWGFMCVDRRSSCIVLVIGALAWRTFASPARRAATIWPERRRARSASSEPSSAAVVLTVVMLVGFLVVERRRPAAR